MRVLSPAVQLREGRTILGLELGSTRIKACLIGDEPGEILATGVHDWESELVDGFWTYSLTAIADGVRAAFASLHADALARHGEPVRAVRALGVSAMMHGYLAFDREGELLVPYRTWRNTSTGPAAAALTELLGVNIPLRWSIAHYRQAALDGEVHVDRVAHLTTLAGYVHERLTGERVLGIGDASGMFPVDGVLGDWDSSRMALFDARHGSSLRELLPTVLRAGDRAGTLTSAGAAWLDGTGMLQEGAMACPPEGDAGTGMVATNAVSVRTGNVSVGTSVFAMVVLDHPLAHVHDEIDVVATPTGDPVAMVHCNNGASELATWVGVFQEFATEMNSAANRDEIYGALFAAALAAAPDGGGVLAYNQIAAEPIAGVNGGAPMILRSPASRLTLSNLIRALLYGVFASLALGMRTLSEERVHVNVMQAHGGVFRTPGAAQQLLAAALDAPVAVARTASEGGAWGMALLASYAVSKVRQPLAVYLAETVFADADTTTVTATSQDRAGFAHYLTDYVRNLPAVRTATRTIATSEGSG